MTKNEDFNWFLGCLNNATIKIEPHYFKISIAGLNKKIFRERIYCYELYHRLRNEICEDYSYKLDGELDKRCHPILHSGIPDFVVHVPKDTNKNLVVIEVKPVTVWEDISKLEKDIKTLKRFIKAGYYRGIMLIYGDGQSKLPDCILTKVKYLVQGYEKRILLAWHKGTKCKLKISMLKNGNFLVA